MARCQRSMYDNKKQSKQQISPLRAARLRYAACSRHCLQTGSLELCLGLFLALMGAVLCFAYSVEGLGVLGCIAAVLACSIPLLLPAFLQREFLIPAGVCISKPKAAQVNNLMFVLCCSVCMGCFSMSIYNGNGPDVLLGVLLALLSCLAYRLSGRNRFFVLAAWLLVAAVYAPGSVKGLGLGTMNAFGAGMMLFGCGVVISGGVGFASCMLRASRKLLEDKINEAKKSGDPVEIERGMLHGASALFTKEELEEAMASPDCATRFITAEFLQSYIEPKVLAALIKLSGDPEPAVGRAALIAISYIWGPNPDDLLQWQLARGLGACPSKRSLGKRKDEPYLAYELPEGTLAAAEKEMRQIQKESDEHMAEVEEALCQQVAQDEDAFCTLLQLAQGKDSPELPVSQVAAQMLGATHSHKAYAALVQLILEGDMAQRRAAIEGFRGAGANAAVHLSRLFSDSREWVRVAGLRAAEALLDSIDSKDYEECNTARLLLRGEIFALARSGKAVSSANALSVLAYFKGEGTELLEGALGSRFAFSRAQALGSLVQANAAGCEDKVLAALSDSSALVRATAIRSAYHLKMKDASAAIEALVVDKNKQVKTLAREFVSTAKLW